MLSEGSPLATPWNLGAAAVEPGVCPNHKVVRGSSTVPVCLSMFSIVLLIANSPHPEIWKSGKPLEPVPEM